SRVMTGAGWVRVSGGGRRRVDASVVIAIRRGPSARVFGLTIIALGTSVPALMTSLIAAFRGNGDIAVGSVIGSNLFNLLGVLGLPALIAPVPLTISPTALVFDLPIMLGVSLLCGPPFYSGYRTDRLAGLFPPPSSLTYRPHLLPISPRTAPAE
ncbi:conjugal transfer protein TraR, partial [Pseudomonas syringae]